MGRERQKAKNRSSVAKVKPKTKSKKKLLHNAIVAAGWNQKETLSQNYRRLGLASKLNHSAGGVEKHNTNPQDSDSDSRSDLDMPNPRSASSSLGLPHPTTDALDVLHKPYNTPLPTQITITETRVLRDPVTGAIISVLEDPPPSSTTTPALPPPPPSHAPLNDILRGREDLSSRSSSPEAHSALHTLLPILPTTRSAADGAGAGGSVKAVRSTRTVRALENAAAAANAVHGGKKVREQSAREKEWIAALVGKYGEVDFRGMSRDRSGLNVMQQSEGDIKRRVGRWIAERDKRAGTL